MSVPLLRVCNFSQFIGSSPIRDWGQSFLSMLFRQLEKHQACQIFSILTHIVPHTGSVVRHTNTHLSSLAMVTAAVTLVHVNSSKWNILTVAYLFKTWTYWFWSELILEYLQDMKTVTIICKRVRLSLIQLNSSNLGYYFIILLLIISNSYFLNTPG